MSISVGRVGMIPTSSVVVDKDRAREDMGDLDALELNMKESGLISPLAVKDNKDGTYKLLAGERRFTVSSDHFDFSSWLGDAKIEQVGGRR